MISFVKNLHFYVNCSILYLTFVSTAKYNKCTIFVYITGIFVILPKEKETTMRRLTLIMVLLTSIILLTGCGNADLELERSQLQTEIETLQTEVDTLQKTRAGLIQKDDIIYVIELEISQSHFSLDLGEHLKDSMNEITIPIQVSEEYYYSVEEGDTLSDEFRVGSLLFKGSIGSWDIKVAQKQIVNRTTTE